MAVALRLASLTLHFTFATVLLLHLMNTLLICVLSQVVREKFLRTSALVDQAERQQFLSNLYVFLADHMHQRFVHQITVFRPFSPSSASTNALASAMLRRRRQSGSMCSSLKRSRRRQRTG